MPTTTTLFQAGMTTGGTWTYVGTLSPAPSPPGTHNGSIDFDTYASGEYVYRYTIPSGHTADVTVNWQGVTVAPINDDCDGAIFISGLQICPGTATINGDNRADCENHIKAPTDSGETAPASWAAPAYVGDLWYKFTAPVCQNAYQVSVAVQGSGTTSDALGVAIQAFRGDCDTLVPITDSGSQSNSNYTAIQFQVPALQAELYYVRVVSVTAGTFSLQLSCASACVPGSAINLEYWPDDDTAATNGIAIGEMYALSADNIYGLPYGSLRLRVA